MNTRTNSLHRKLDPALRAQVEEALRVRPPKLCTYREVYEHFGLKDRGISFGALSRCGRYVRRLGEGRIIPKGSDGHRTPVDGSPNAA